MPRYFFNVHDGRDLVDTEGSSLPNDDAARAEAVQTSAEMLRRFSQNGLWSGEHWEMAVTDQDGRRVATLQLSGQMHLGAP